jgi:hypothetical protein
MIINNHGAKVRRFLQSHNPSCVAFYIPNVWYIVEKRGFYSPFPLNLVKSLRQVGNNIVDMFSTDTQADG